MKLSDEVSVIMPIHNGAAFLRSAVESILTQQHENFELILVDDGSTDESWEIVGSFQSDPRIRPLRLERKRGLAEALNSGLNIASADFIARMDADDIALPHRLSTQLEYLQMNPDLSLVGADIQDVTRQGEPIGRPRRFPTLPHQVEWKILFGCPIAHPTVLARREFFEIVGTYRLGLSPAEDHDLWLRALGKVRLGNVPEVLLSYRQHGTSMTKTMPIPEEIDRTTSRIVSQLAGRNCSTNEVRLLRDPHLAQENDLPILISAASILNDLFLHYSDLHLAKEERRYIRYHAAWKTRQIALAIGRFHPSEALRLAAFSPLLDARHLGDFLRQRFTRGNVIERY